MSRVLASKKQEASHKACISVCDNLIGVTRRIDFRTTKSNRLISIPNQRNGLHMLELNYILSDEVVAHSTYKLQVFCVREIRPTHKNLMTTHKV